MIKKQSGYYYSSEQPQPIIQQTVQEQPESKLPLQIVGNVKGYLQHVAAQVARIKNLKAMQKQQQLKNSLILDQLASPKNELSCGQNLSLSITIPSQLLQIDRRISVLEQRIPNNQIVRQKMQRKGRLSQRAQLLIKQLQKLAQKNSDYINTSLQNFTKNMDQKQQQNKVLYLYDAFSKTNALGEEIQMLDKYLSNLNQIMMKFKALPKKQYIIGVHERLLQKRRQNSQRIKKLYQQMKDEYEKVVKEIESL